MTGRLVGIGLLLLAASLHFGLTVPARRARDAAREAFAQARQERERLRAEMTRLERQAAAAGNDAPESAAAAARALRLALLGATRGLAIGDVQIATQPERSGGHVARGSLVGTGRQVDVLRVAGRLAEPGSGVSLERLELALRPDGIRFEAAVKSARPVS